MTLEKNYFTETCHDAGTAFSFKVKQKLTEEQTPFQKIEIYETEKFGNLMAIDGFMMLTTRDNFLYHEMMSHPALYCHPRPKNIVIIGGGDCGTLKEVLKHDEVESATQIDIDERVTRLSEKYFPELCSSNNDPRATLLFDDGIKWMIEAQSSSVDIIIVDSTDPIGPGEVLFTEEFYQHCFRVMRDGGIIVHQSESPLLHLETIIKPMHVKMKKIGFENAHTLQFPQPCYPTGWWTATLAVKNGSLDSFRKDDVANKNFATQYYNEHIHKAAFVQPELMKSALSDLN